MKSALAIAASLAAMFMAAPVAALAQNAIVADDTALHAGPAYQYPRVAYVPQDARVFIHGCLRGFSWCDVSWRGNRGWIDASDLTYAWNNRYVVVQEWGPRIGLPVIGFAVQDYWTRYYRDRPWWSQRYTWFEREGRGRDRDVWRERREDWRDRDGRGDTRFDWRDRRDRNERDFRSDRQRREWRNGDDDLRRQDQWRGGQRGQDNTWSRRDDRVNRQDDRGQGPGVGAERNRSFENAPTGAIPRQRQERGVGGQGRPGEERM